MNRLDLGSPIGLAAALLPELLLSGWSLIVLLVVMFAQRMQLIRLRLGR